MKKHKSALQKLDERLSQMTPMETYKRIDMLVRKHVLKHPTEIKGILGRFKDMSGRKCQNITRVMATDYDALLMLLEDFDGK